MSILSKVRSALLNPVLDISKSGPRFFLSGIFSRVSRAERLEVRLAGGARVFVRPRQSDFATLRQVFRDREYGMPDHVAERVDRECKRLRAIGSTPVIVDAGANIGAASVWFKSQFPDAAIVAIEPDAGNLAMARENIAPLPGVTIMEAAVGGEPGFVSVVGADQGWAVQTERADAGCPVVTIDQAVGTVPSGKLVVVKIDIEGFEKDLFENNLSWLDEVLLVYIEPHDWMLPGVGSSRGFQRAFGERDFEILLQGENLIYLRRG